MELDMTALPAPVDKSEKAAQPKRITKKIRAAVDALVHGDVKSIPKPLRRPG
jgi:hypothetical protein